MTYRYDAYGYPCFPGSNGYSSADDSRPWSQFAELIEAEERTACLDAELKAKQEPDQK